MNGKKTAYPLSDLKVLDFSRVLAGPFAGRMLSDLGADVIKVEPPEGDVTRFWGKEIANIQGYYHQQNIGKRNICIDLRAKGSSDLIKRLVQVADIVIENYRPDVMSRLGLSYQDLKTTNPAIIMLSISGFGRDGPESHRPAYAPVIHAESGLIHRNWTRNGGTLHDLPISLADTNAALHGLVATLAAIHMRNKTGSGQHIDIAMIDATAATDDQLQYDLEDSFVTAPLPNEVWETGFGHVLISSDFRLFFRLLVDHSGLTDPSTSDMELEEKISSRRKAVGDLLRTITEKKEFVSIMTEINVAWGEVRDPKTLAKQKTIVHRNAIIDTDDRNGGMRPTTQSPYRFSNAKSGAGEKTSHRGEDYETVLNEWLGLNSDEVTELFDQKIILHDPDWIAK